MKQQHDDEIRWPNVYVFASRLFRKTVKGRRDKSSGSGRSNRFSYENLEAKQMLATLAIGSDSVAINAPADVVIRDEMAPEQHSAYSVGLDFQQEFSAVAFDDSGRLSLTSDEAGRKRLFQYDAYNRLSGEVWVQDGDVVNRLTFNYDQQDNLNGADDAAGTYEFTYNEPLRLLQVESSNRFEFIFDGNAITGESIVGASNASDPDSYLPLEAYHWQGDAAVFNSSVGDQLHVQLDAFEPDSFSGAGDPSSGNQGDPNNTGLGDPNSGSTPPTGDPGTDLGHEPSTSNDPNPPANDSPSTGQDPLANIGDENGGRDFTKPLNSVAGNDNYPPTSNPSVSQDPIVTHPSDPSPSSPPSNSTVTVTGQPTTVQQPTIVQNPTASSIDKGAIDRLIATVNLAPQAPQTVFADLVTVGIEGWQPATLPGGDGSMTFANPPTHSFMTFNAFGNLTATRDALTGETQTLAYNHRQQIVTATTYSGDGNRIADVTIEYDSNGRPTKHRMDIDGRGPAPPVQSNVRYNGFNAWSNQRTDTGLVERYSYANDDLFSQWNVSSDSDTKELASTTETQIFFAHSTAIDTERRLSPLEFANREAGEEPELFYRRMRTYSSTVGQNNYDSLYRSVNQSALLALRYNDATSDQAADSNGTLQAYANSLALGSVGRGAALDFLLPMMATDAGLWGDSDWSAIIETLMNQREQQVEIPVAESGLLDSEERDATSEQDDQTEMGSIVGTIALTSGIILMKKRREKPAN